MNRKQLIVLWIGIIAIVSLSLYVPWRWEYRYYHGLDYGFIWASPEHAVGVSLQVLAIEWVAVAIIIGGLIISLRR